MGAIGGAVVDANGLSGTGWGNPMGGNCTGGSCAGVAIAANGPVVGTGNTLDGAGIDGTDCVPTRSMTAGPDTIAAAEATTAIVPVISSDSRTIR